METVSRDCFADRIPKRAIVLDCLCLTGRRFAGAKEDEVLGSAVMSDPPRRAERRQDGLGTGLPVANDCNTLDAVA